MEAADREVERILAMTDAEVVAEAAAEGIDLELQAMEMRVLLDLAVENVRRRLGR